MCLKTSTGNGGGGGGFCHSISFFWSASLCIWKIRLASTLTHTHRHTRCASKGNAMPSCSVRFCSVLFCSVGKWKKWIFDRFMTIEPSSFPFLNYCHRNRRKISYFFGFATRVPLRPPASISRIGILVWISASGSVWIRLSCSPLQLESNRKRKLLVAFFSIRAFFLPWPRHLKGFGHVFCRFSSLKNRWVCFRK